MIEALWQLPSQKAKARPERQTSLQPLAWISASQLYRFCHKKVDFNFGRRNMYHHQGLLVVLLMLIVTLLNIFMLHGLNDTHNSKLNPNETGELVHTGHKLHEVRKGKAYILKLRPPSTWTSCWFCCILGKGWFSHVKILVLYTNWNFVMHILNTSPRPGDDIIICEQ